MQLNWVQRHWSGCGAWGGDEGLIAAIKLGREYLFAPKWCQKAPKCTHLHIKLQTFSGAFPHCGGHTLPSSLPLGTLALLASTPHSGHRSPLAKRNLDCCHWLCLIFAAPRTSYCWHQEWHSTESSPVLQIKSLRSAFIWIQSCEWKYAQKTFL